MKIAGFDFRPLKGQTLYGGAGIYIYMHQASGKCFVRAMRNCRVQRGKNNYPKLLKEMLKTNPSEVLLWLAELPKDTKDALFIASRAVVTQLSENGSLYKQPAPCRGGIYRQLPGEESDVYTVWRLTHKKTGAVFYFEDLKGVDVRNKVSHRMLTFNNYVFKQIPNENRMMYAFAKKFFPLDVCHWDMIDMELELKSEKEAQVSITKFSKIDLENNRVVLSKVMQHDALYYRNNMLRLPHAGIEEYLQFSNMCATILEQPAAKAA